MAEALSSDEGSRSAWRSVYSIATYGGRMLAICKSNAPGKAAKIRLIISMPSALRSQDWPSPSPVSCLIAEVAYRNGGALSLDAEVQELVPFYERYGFKETGAGGLRPMKLDDTSALCEKYALGSAWNYARALPPLPGR